jgi:hypothetical protein
LEPELAPEERIGRAWDARVRELAEGTKLGAAVSEEFRSATEDSIRELRKQGAFLGIRERLDTKGNFLGFHPQRPSWTHLTEKAFAASSTYRMFSSVAHGALWACTKVGFKVTDGWPENGSDLMEVSDPSEALGSALGSGVHVFLTAAWRALSAVDCPRDSFATAAQKIADELAWPDQVRVWANPPS